MPGEGRVADRRAVRPPRDSPRAVHVAAALAPGNAVLAKPAEATPLIAARATALLHEAGVNMRAIFVDHGLLRKDEAEEVRGNFHRLGIEIETEAAGPAGAARVATSPQPRRPPAARTMRETEVGDPGAGRRVPPAAPLPGGSRGTSSWTEASDKPAGSRAESMMSPAICRSWPIATLHEMPKITASQPPMSFERMPANSPVPT